jgi:putative transposase
LRCDGKHHGPENKSLSSLTAGCKSIPTTRINLSRSTPGAPVWQRIYWDDIIRYEIDFAQIRESIRNNPMHWDINAEDDTRAGKSQR